MTIDHAINLMKIEKLCVERANQCDRDCAKCALVQEDYELLEAYDMVLEVLEDKKREYSIFCEEVKTA